ncbi:hypothetical protein [Vibrio stylophorae]|uniref:hypothetical protein n=1 Tax=Vibrio stylophorae TaxID=659351 RepID=UPI001F452885|nr:hypothetical protein [Vibrio stylophorae]
MELAPTLSGLFYAAFGAITGFGNKIGMLRASIIRLREILSHCAYYDEIAPPGFSQNTQSSGAMQLPSSRGAGLDVAS